MTQRQGRRLGPYVRELMEKHNPPLEPGDLQKCLGISQPAVSRKLSGDRGFDLHELIPLAQLLGCDVHDLLMGAVHAPDPHTRAQSGERASTEIVRPIHRRKRDDRTGDTHGYKSRRDYVLSQNVTDESRYARVA